MFLLNLVFVQPGKAILKVWNMKSHLPLLPPSWSQDSPGAGDVLPFWEKRRTESWGFACCGGVGCRAGAHWPWIGLTGLLGTWTKPREKCHHNWDIRNGAGKMLDRLGLPNQKDFKQES